MRVLLVDDHTLVRNGIASLLEANNIDVIGEAGDGLEALEKARQLNPDIILMDINMPRCNGLEATRLIKAEMPQIKIIILTAALGPHLRCPW
jgi:DNA-binding NarL/FixJ family response regulator